jgi:hypothetical protein
VFCIEYDHSTSVETSISSPCRENQLGPAGAEELAKAALPELLFLNIR